MHYTKRLSEKYSFMFRYIALLVNLVFCIWPQILIRIITYVFSCNTPGKEAFCMPVPSLAILCRYV